MLSDLMITILAIKVNESIHDSASQYDVQKECKRGD